VSEVKRLRKEVVYDHPPEAVWTALTDRRALAEWLMPNDFEPVEGRRFQFRVDPMLSFEGIVDGQVPEVDAPRRLVYTWVSRVKDRPPHEPMTLVWTLEPVPGGTRLVLEQSGLEQLSLWWRFSQRMGWNRMLKTLLPRVLPNVSDDGEYGTSTVPDDFAK
jgi:uncharacterized protein YndB with AHSA1/START domain